MLFSNLLPNESFVQTGINFIPNPVVWVGDNNLSKYAIYNDPTSNIFALAERYGGSGANGALGSGRCVNIDQIQIKGSGKNLLTAKQLFSSPDECTTTSELSNFSHTNGFLPLDEALREYIFSYAFDKALPFGAVKSHGIILTGVNNPAKYPEDVGHTHIPGALLLRDQTVRVGHYIPIINGDTRLLCKAGYVTDSLRTELAIKSFGSLAIHCNINSNSEDESVNQVFQFFVKRFATQSAWAFVKRIMHSAISESNISIDGRMIDFGVSSMLSDYGNIFIAYRQPSVYDENNRRYEIIKELKFALTKFSGYRITELKTMIEYFDSIYKSELGNALLCCIGTPRSQLNRINYKTKIKLVDLFFQIVKKNNYYKFDMFIPGDKNATMPDQMGKYFFPGAICHLARTNGSIEGIIKYIPEDIAPELVTIYNEIKDQSNNEEYFRINGLRQNVRFADLYQPNIKSNTEKLAFQDKLLSNLFIDDIKHKINMYLEIENDSFTLYDGKETQSVLINETIDINNIFERFFNNV